MKHVLLDILFPRRCPVCGQIVVPKGRLICPGCLKKLSFVRQPVCKKCGKELMNEGEEFCFDCVRHKRSFEFGRALLNYDDVSGPSMARIKYHNKREYLDFYSQVMAARYETVISRMNADALIPIPIHRARYRKRGFNQAQVLAEKLGELLGIPVCPRALKRRKKTDPQKDLTAAQRLKNLEEAFEVGELPAGVRTVILIDDIYTTGSTIEACTRVLKKAGISQVYFLTICIGHNTG